MADGTSPIDANGVPIKKERSVETTTGSGGTDTATTTGNADGRAAMGAGAQEEEADAKTLFDQEIRELEEEVRELEETDPGGEDYWGARADLDYAREMRSALDSNPYWVDHLSNPQTVDRLFGNGITTEEAYQRASLGMRFSASGMAVPTELPIPTSLLKGLAKGGVKWAAKRLGRAGRARRGTERIRGNRKRRKDRKDCKRRGNPVFMPTGIPQHVDPGFNLPGLIELELGGVFYGDIQTVGPLGRGRMSILDATIERNEDGGFTFLDDDGFAINFPAPTPIPEGWVEGDTIRPTYLMQGRDRTLIFREDSVRTTFAKGRDAVWRIERIEDRNGNAVRFERDGDGELLAITTPEQSRLMFTNANGLRTQIDLVAPTGERLVVMRYAYDAGNMVRAESSFGETHEFAYDADHRMVETRRNGAYRAVHEHDAKGRRTRTVASRGFAPARFEYDEEARVTTYLPEGDRARAERFHYNENDNIVREVNALGHERRIEENEQGLVSSEIDGEGHATSYRYDPNGRIRAITDEAGRQTAYVWSDDGDLETLIDNEGNAWGWDYDHRGNAISETDPLGHVSETRYDEAGQAVATMRHDGLMEQRAYDAHYRLAEILDYRGGRTRYQRDAFGRVAAIQTPDGEMTRYEYADGDGAPFDVPSITIRPDGVRETQRFAGHGRTVETVDGEGRRTLYRYDAFHNLIESTDPRGGTLRFDYDDEFRLTRVTNQVGRHWTFEHDAAGRVVRETDFAGLVFAYEYDKADRLTRTTHPDGREIEMEYDPSGLLLARRVRTPGSDAVEEERFTYDDRGMMASASNDHAAVMLEYDARGRVVVETANGIRIETEYDCCGNRTLRRIGEHETAYRYDPMGAITGLSLNGRTALEIDRDALGRAIERRSGEGYVLRERYDRVGQLAAQQVRSAGPSASYPGTSLPTVPTPSPVPAEWTRSFIWDRTYAPRAIEDPLWGRTAYEADANGQVVRADHALRPANDTRAPLLAKAVGSDVPGFPAETSEYELFAYAPTMDIAGSRTVQPNAALRVGTEPWSVAPGGRVERAVGPSGERIDLHYDTAGRLTERRVEREGFRPQVWRFGWDGFDRMVRAECPDGSAWTYRHDPFGRRIEKRCVRASGKDRESGRPFVPRGTRFVWDGDTIAVEERFGTNGPSEVGGGSDGGDRTYWHFEPETFVPLLRESPGVTSRGSTLLHVLSDHLGTPRELIAPDGSVRWSVSMRLWGGVRDRWRAEAANDNGGGSSRASSTDSASSRPTDFDPCPIRFQGQWHDHETGQYYNRFRTYDPLTGQYVSPDPIGLTGGLRTSGYVDNPLMAIDQLGLAQKCEECKRLYGRIVKNSVGTKSTSGTRGVVERIRELKEDKLDLYNKAYSVNPHTSKPPAGTTGSLFGKGTWLGHISQVTNMQNRLRSNIVQYEKDGCSSSYKRLPDGVKDAARMTIPSRPGF